VATTLLVLAVAWLVTIPLVLGLARVLGSVTTSRAAVAQRPAAAWAGSEADDNVVPLVPRGRNGLVQADDLRQAS
jgi:hypothetical protein